MNVSPNRQKKEEAVLSLSETLKKAKTVVLADYRGLTMHQLSQLRTKLAQVNAQLTVVKNTLLSRALALSNYPQLEDRVLTGPTALCIAYGDEVSPLNILAAFARLHQLPTFKGGYLERVYLPAVRLQELAKLSSRAELLRYLIGTISAPLYGIVNVLDGNLRNLVLVLRR